MTAWLCPSCTQKLDDDRAIKLTFDMRDPNATAPSPGRCWSCGARRLTAVPDPDDRQEPPT